MGVKADQELRLFTDEARQSVQDTNGGRYTLEDVRVELRQRLEAHPEILERHLEEFIDLLVKESDDRATQASQLSLLEVDERVEDEIWALGTGQRVRAGSATYTDLQRRAVIRQSNVDRVVAANARQQADDDVLAPYFTTPTTTVAEARAAYLTALAHAA